MKGAALVVGAGIAGLATARSLLAGGLDVEVRERYSALSTVGTLLGIWPTAWASLEKLGAARGVVALSLGSGKLLRPDGRVLAALTLPAGSRGVARMDLLETLLAGLPEGVVHWSEPVTSLADLPDADVIVAADGVHSAVRDAAFPRARLRDAGSVAFRGVAPIATSEGSETWGRGLLFGRAPFPGGGSNWYAGVRTDLAGGRDDDPLAVLRRLYRDWHPGVQEVLDSITSAMIDRRRIEESRPLGTFVSGNIALVGDAAHAMAPHLGRGGCESLVDGLTLGEALAAAPTVAQGLAQYDATRRRASQRAVHGSRLMSRLSNERRHPWARDTLVTGIGRLLSARQPARRPASTRSVS
jgi:2-polyprenyl-6-methoxyphenol hydroxylase-like FAD-dependent oxidoreductase